MSLIIKGMEMPEFPAFRENDDKVSFPAAVVLVKGRAPRLVINYKIGYADTDIRSYELLELPTPHGRPIDADKLYNKFKNEYCNKNCDKSVQGKICSHCGVPRAFNLIQNAPTVIEAEAAE